jgi:hypothetical protein
MLDLAITRIPHLYEKAAYLVRLAAYMVLQGGSRLATSDSPSPSPNDTYTTIPTPNPSEAPPGFRGFILIINWGTWCAVIICVGGFMIIAVRMAIKHQKGEAGGHAGSLIIVSLSCVIIVSARLIVVRVLIAAG